MSDDSWGWALLEVTDGLDPTLTVRRFSRGDELLDFVAHAVAPFTCRGRGARGS